MKLTEIFENYWKKGITPEVLLELHRLGIETDRQSGIEIINGSLQDRFVKRLDKSLEITAETEAPGLEQRSGRETQDLTAVIVEIQKEKSQNITDSEAEVLYKEANDFFQKGGLIQAIEGFKKYLAGVKPNPQNIENIIIANSKVSQAYNTLKNYQSSIEYSEKQKEGLDKELKNPESQFDKDRLLKWKISCLVQTSRCYQQLAKNESDPSKAEGLYQAAIKNKQEENEAVLALSYSAISETGKKEQIGYNHSFIGMFYKKIKNSQKAITNYTKAIEYLQMSLNESRDQKDIVRLENKIAHCQIDMSGCLASKEEILDYLNQAINTYNKNFDVVKNNTGELKALRYALISARSLVTDQKMIEKYTSNLSQVNKLLKG